MEMIENKKSAIEENNFKQAGFVDHPSSWIDVQNIVSEIKWDWYGWLPKGMLVIVASAPGDGKSAFLLRCAGSFLKGLDWPDGTPFNGKTGSVVWCESEAAQAINLQRAVAWGYPPDQFLTPLEDPLEDLQLNDNRHKESLRKLAFRDDVRLIIVDSLRGIHNKDENSSETMEVVKHLAELARDSGKVVLVSHHLRKPKKTEPGVPHLNMLRGSNAIAAIPRVVCLIDVPNIGLPDLKRITVVKNNLMRFPDPIGMYINDSEVTFTEPSTGPIRRTKQMSAVDFLIEYLSDGQKPSTEVYEDGEKIGISRSTMKRAQKLLGVKADKNPDKWFLKLPEDGGGK